MRKTVLIILAFVLFAMGGFACDYQYELGVKTRPSIVLITVESLRADRLGCYGNPDSLTPNIDFIAQNGRRFDRAYATSSWALPSLASIFTGQTPTRHGLQSARQKPGRKIKADRLNIQLMPLAEHLKQNGYATYAITSGDLLAPEFGFDQGFDHYSHKPGGTFRTVAAELPALLPYLEANAKSKVPYFLWIHLTDPGYPYLPEQPYIDRLAPQWADSIGQLVSQDLVTLVREGKVADDPALLDLLKALYASQVAAVDQGIADVLKMLPANQQSIVALAGTHGEAFGEHKSFGHGDNLYNETLRVPMILALPDSSNKGQAVSYPVSQIDLMPTLLDAADIPLPVGIEGVSLLQEPPADRLLYAMLRRPKGKWHAVIHNQTKFISQTRPTVRYLFDLATDPTEANNLIDAQPQRADALAKANKDHSKQPTLYPPVTHTKTLHHDRLRALRFAGYLR